MVLPDSVQGLHLHSKRHVIYIYVEEDKLDEGQAFAEQHLPNTNRKHVEPVTPFEQFMSCEHCGRSECSSLMTHPYRPTPWIGPGSSIMAMHQSSWNRAKAHTPTISTIDDARRFCKQRNLPYSRWTAGYCEQTEGKHSLVSVAHCLEEFNDTPDLVFLTEVIDRNQTTQNGLQASARIVEVGNSFNQRLDRSRALDILKVNISGSVDKSMFQNMVKSACSGVYKAVQFVFSLPPAADTSNKPVTKRGMSTGETYGNIVELKRFYSRPRAKWPLQECIAIRPALFADHGDSGSLVVARAELNTDETCTLQAYGLVLGAMQVIDEDGTKLMCVICSKIVGNLSALSETLRQPGSLETLP